MAREDDPTAKIVSLMKDHTKPVSRPRRKASPSVAIRGDGNIVGNNNMVLNQPQLVSKTVVKTGDGVIDAAQKAELLRLRDEWLDTHNRLKRTPMPHSRPMAALNRKMGVNKYAEIPQERFAEARAWMQRQIAMLRNGMRSAPARLPNWRSSTISYIKASCKNQLGDAAAYSPFIERQFGKSSLTALTDTELQKTRVHIAGRKQGMKPD